MRWAEATSWDRAASAVSVLLVPLGSTEQHGAHLPLDTDTRIAVAVAETVADRRGDTLVGPALPYGASGEHQAFAGTLSIGTDALVQVVIELVRSATGDRTPPDPRPSVANPPVGTPSERVRAAAGLRPGPAPLVVLVNGHGGNAAAVDAAVARLRGEHRPVAAWAPCGPATDSHAGQVETSVMLALAPHLVHLDRASPGVVAPLNELAGSLARGGLAAVAPNGVLGDPTGASPARGRMWLEEFADDLDRTVTAALADPAASARPEASP